MPMVRGLKLMPSLKFYETGSYDRSPDIFFGYPTEEPGLTMSEGDTTTRRPSESTALRIMP